MSAKPAHDDRGVDAATLAALAAFPARLAEFYAAVPRERIDWRPPSWDGVPSEPFSPIEQVCHVRDIEIDGYHVRLARTRAESEPELASIDGEALAIERGYARDDAGAALAAFAAARAQTLKSLASVAPSEWSRSAMFEGRRITLRGLVHLLCSHDQQHLAGLQWLLARMTA